MMEYKELECCVEYDLKENKISEDVREKRVEREEREVVRSGKDADAKAECSYNEVRMETGFSVEELEDLWWKGEAEDKRSMEELSERGIRNVADYFEKIATENRTKLCLMSAESEKKYTYDDADKFANRVSNYFLEFAETKLKKGDVVALLMENCCEYICIWLGLCKIGVTVALLNTNLRGNLLYRALCISNPKCIICSDELLSALKDALLCSENDEKSLNIRNSEAAEHGIDCNILIYIYQRSHNVSHDFYRFASKGGGAEEEEKEKEKEKEGKEKEGKEKEEKEGKEKEEKEGKEKEEKEKEGKEEKEKEGKEEKEKEGKEKEGKEKEEKEKEEKEKEEKEEKEKEKEEKEKEKEEKERQTVKRRFNERNFTDIVLSSANEFKHLSSRPDQTLRKDVQDTSACFYIYTSGTTGKSKAAIFNHRRVIGAGVTWARHMSLTDKDIMYITLPLYHGNGGIVGVSTAWRCSASMVIRKRFSASNFFKDVSKHKCTSAIYVGELWRYILLKPPTEEDQHTTLRVIAGNGLRPSVFKKVKERFKIPKIVEHYGQTEMPSAHPMINSYGKLGACGFLPKNVRGKYGKEKLLKYDFLANHVWRDPITNFCVEAPIDEKTGIQIGEAVVKLDSDYCGYTDSSETCKVIYQDVFEKGDRWYHSGDILQIDKHGFVYFNDRAGDSYRRNGENVSTSEVQEILCECDLIEEVSVFGLRLPCNLDDTSEKLGCCSVVFKEKVMKDVLEDLNKAESSESDVINASEAKRHSATVSYLLNELRAYMKAHLPKFAIPQLLRIRTKRHDITSTLRCTKYKYICEALDFLNQKNEIGNFSEGKCSIRQTKDSENDKINEEDLYQKQSFYIHDRNTDRYIPFTKEIYTDISLGKFIV